MKRKHVLILLAFLIIIGILPLVVGTYYINLLSLALIYGMFAMSLNILVGYAGLVSLGHAVFFGTSAYVVAVLNTNNVFQGGTMQLGMGVLAALGSAIVLALIFGLLTLRSRGVYFIMLTLALSMMLWGIAYKWQDVTGGQSGIGGVYLPALEFIHLDLSTAFGYFYFVLFLFVIAAILIYYIVVGSSFGRVLLGIKNNELRMRSLGYNVWLYLYIAFLFSGFFAGLSGVLFVYHTHFVGPGSLHLITSAQVLLMVILGGSGELFGPLVGAGTLIFLQDFIGTYTERWVMVLGITYVVVVVFFHRGIYVSIKELGGILWRRIYFWKE